MTAADTAQVRRPDIAEAAAGIADALSFLGAFEPDDVEGYGESTGRYERMEAGLHAAERVVLEAHREDLRRRAASLEDHGGYLLSALTLDISAALDLPPAALDVDWWAGCDEDWTLPVYVQLADDEHGDTGAVADLASWRATYREQVAFLAEQMREGMA